MAFIRGSAGGGGGYPSTEEIIWRNTHSYLDAGEITLEHPITEYKLIKFDFAANFEETHIETVVDVATILSTGLYNPNNARNIIAVGYERSGVTYLRPIYLVANTTNKLYINYAYSVPGGTTQYSSVAVIDKVIGIK